MLNDIISAVNDALYSYILLIILVLGGIFFTIRTRFVSFRLLSEQLRAVTEKSDGGVSSFQALMVSTASRVGTGNIVGVSTALCLGGFGSVFWMWIIAIIGSASAFVESTLAQIYKRKGPDGCYGGPAYYIETALKNRFLAVVFSVLLILTYGVGFNMLASYNLQSTFSTYEFYDKSVTPVIIGIVLASLVCYCLMGGGGRVIKATSFLVPAMGVAYILVALVIVLLNITSLPSVLSAIFSEAFNIEAIFKTTTTNTTAPNASASAEVSHPVKQGLVQVLSVFIDTILVCSATAFMCMCSGVEPTEELSGAPYVQAALSETLGGFGPIFITVAMILFAFTTLLGNLYYVDKCIIHIMKRTPGKLFMTVYRIIASLIVFAGSCLSADLLWNIADVLMGGMTLINMPVIFILSKYAIRALKDYEKQRKDGRTPVFYAKDIDLPHNVDYWN